MTRIPTHRGGTVYRRKRDESLPVGNVSGRGQGSGTASRVIAALLEGEPELLVAISDDGQIFAVDANGLRAQAITAQYPHWIVGVYTRELSGWSIGNDLRVRAAELRRAAA
jgi:hypothetical protein